MLVEDFIQLLRFEKHPAPSKKSLYKNLSDSIRVAVLSGHISPGAQLPASRYLAQALSISRSTIINAYEQLIAEGIAESKPGDGTYIKCNLRTGKTSGARADNSLAVLSNRGVSFTKLNTLLDTENHSLFLPAYGFIEIPGSILENANESLCSSALGYVSFQTTLGRVPTIKRIHC